ncbi:MAG: preprotein translocase subunit SecE [Desulfatirhabdiaceae bacterium]
MGRLLKKKDPQLKKKKKAETEPNDTGDMSISQSSNSGASAAVLKDTSARMGSPKKSIGDIQTPNFLLKNRYVSQSIQFLREVKVELKKVAWPTRKQTAGSTVAVIILVMLISLFLGVVDVGLSSLIHTVLN